MRPSADQRIDAERVGPENSGEVAGVWTVPNLITVLRLLSIPVFLWLLFVQKHQVGAAVLLACLGASDWADGYVARRFHQVSAVGKVIDPVADRVLIASAVIAIIVYGAVPIWFGVLTLVRELLISCVVIALASLGARRIDVIFVGKAGTFALMFAYPAFLISYGGATWQEPFRVAAWVTGGVGITLAWIAAAMYIGPARTALLEGKKDRLLSREPRGRALGSSGDNVDKSSGGGLT
ncbi:MAG: CDP-alcohol phosphatidyltransferase family protein [Acidimicrobiales bacterium]|jgi:cardiolipin synthase